MSPKSGVVIDPYLWDRSGEPDDELRRVESLLARYRIADRVPQIAVLQHSEDDTDGQA